MRVVNSDPFAALDSKSPTLSQDEISARFPSLDQLSLLHEQGSKFEFDASSAAPSKPKDLSQRVTEKLADDAFAMPSVKPLPAPLPFANPQIKTASMSRAQQIIAGAPELQAIGQTTSKSSSYVSHGTMTSPKLSPLDPPKPRQQQIQPPMQRFPSHDHHRASSLSRDAMSASPRLPERSLLGDSSRPHSVSRHSSFQLLQKEHRPLSARPSLESTRPSADAIEPVMRTKSTGSRQRPSSAYLESHMDYLREKESSNDHSASKGNFFTKHIPHNKKSTEPSPQFTDPSRTPSPPLSDTAIDSNVEFLKQMEETEKKDAKSKRSSIHKHSKKASLPSLFAGKFGDAFKRFENNTAQPNRTPSPLHDGRGLMTPILGSEATDERSDDGRADTMDEVVMTGEQKRELERQRLEDEERRVENAARAYKTQMAEREARGATGRLPSRGMGASKASMIQNKVQSLLNENVRPAEVQRTAQGYGKYTDSMAEQERESDDRDRRDFSSSDPPRASTMSQPAKTVAKKPAPPGAPPKPVHLLHTGSSVGAATNLPPANPYAYASPRSSATKLTQSPPKPAPRQLQQGTMAAATSVRPGPSGIEPRDGSTAAEKDEHLRNFKQRFPSLSGIEMVETIVGADAGRRQKGAEV